MDGATIERALKKAPQNAVLSRDRMMRSLQFPDGRIRIEARVSERHNGRNKSKASIVQFLPFIPDTHRPLGPRRYPLASSGMPSARAFTAVAAVVRFKDRAIFVTSSFFFARPLNL